MTQEEKYLLIQDLSSRLPYEVIIKTILNNGKLIGFDTEREELHLRKLNDKIYRYYTVLNDDPKPYLRSLSNMTEDEREELFQIWKLGKENGSESVTKLLKDIFNKAINENDFLKLCTSFENWIDVMTWFNKHHFDYRGLIHTGLALEAPEGMYKF